MRMRMVIQTSSQTIKQILELCEAYGMPAEIVQLIKNKCWKLTRNGRENEDAIQEYAENHNR